MRQGMKNFDERIKEQLEGFEMPYDPAAWARFEQMLPKAAPPAPTGMSNVAKLGIVAAVTAIVVVTAYVWPSHDVAEQPSDKAVAAETGTLTEEGAGTSTVMGNDGAGEEAIATMADRKAAPVADAREVGRKQAGEVGQSLPESPVTEERTMAQTPAAPATTESRPGKGMAGERQPAAVPTEDFNLKMAVSRNSVCVGEEVSFMALSTTGGLRYEWIFGDGERSGRSEAVKTFLGPGVYNVVLTASRAGTVVERTETITVNPAPVAMFSMERPVVGIPLYHLASSPQQGEQLQWEFSDGRTDAGGEVRHLFRSRGTATAKLTVTNAQGCSSSREQTVRIDEDFRLFAETGFTPNGDGINDLFLPKALEVMETPFEMTVRDASGREVFRTSALSEPWNGREFNTGITLPRGAYLWTVVLTEPILKNPVFTGSINIQ
jgi:hypothetical protein